MSKKNNDKKKVQLGMAQGTARNRLIKSLMFSMSKELDRNFCFQCGFEIESIDQFSIEHKIPWLDSEDPVGLYFDLDNISFSHHSCNVGAARQNEKGTIRHGTRSAYKKGCRCGRCKDTQAAVMRKYRKGLKN